MPGTNGMRERAVRAVLGGWVLLSNPSPQAPNAPKADWDEVRNYDTAWKCEAGRRDEAIELAREQATRRGRQAEGATLDAMLRYRCAYTDHPRPRWQRWLRKVVGR